MQKKKQKKTKALPVSVFTLSCFFSVFAEVKEEDVGVK